MQGLETRCAQEFHRPNAVVQMLVDLGAGATSHPPLFAHKSLCEFRSHKRLQIFRLFADANGIDW